MTIRNYPDMCQGLNSHYFHIIGDGHQPNSRGLYTHYKDSLLKVGGLPSPIQGVCSYVALILWDQFNDQLRSAVLITGHRQSPGFAFAYDQIGIVDSQRSVSVKVQRSGAVRWLSGDWTCCGSYGCCFSGKWLVCFWVWFFRWMGVFHFRVVFTPPTEVLPKNNTAPCKSANSTLQKYLSTSRMFDPKRSRHVWAVLKKQRYIVSLGGGHFVKLRLVRDVEDR